MSENSNAQPSPAPITNSATTPPPSVVDAGPPTPASLAEALGHLGANDGESAIDGLLALVERQRSSRADLRSLESRLRDADALAGQAGFERGRAGTLQALGKRGVALAAAVEVEDSNLREKLAEITADPDLSAEGRRKREAGAREARDRRVQAIIDEEARTVDELVGPYRSRVQAQLREALKAHDDLPAAERRERARDFIFATSGLAPEQIAAAFEKLAMHEPWAADVLRLLAFRFAGDEAGSAWPRISLALRRARSERAAALLNGSENGRVRELAVQLALLRDSEREFSTIKTAVKSGAADLARAKLEGRGR